VDGRGGAGKGWVRTWLGWLGCGVKVAIEDRVERLGRLGLSCADVEPTEVLSRDHLRITCKHLVSAWSERAMERG